MLDTVLAEKLAKRVMHQLGYNINIMNDRGIIIASGDSKRIGDFHEIAYNIIHQKLEIGIAKKADDGIGIKAPGVNMPIVYENQVIGVIGISGNPEEIMSFAKLVKLSIETMLEYEFYKEQVRRKQTTRNSFLNALLFEEPLSCSKIGKLAKQLQYNGELYRLPLIIKLVSPGNISQLLSLIKGIPSYSQQDISFEISPDTLIIFKPIFPNPVKSFRQKIQQFVNEINLALADTGTSAQCVYYAGTLQKEYQKYRIAYQHALWLENTVASDSGVYFFHDYVLEYLQHSIPVHIYEEVFSVYKELLGNTEMESLIDTLDAFYKNRLSVCQTAKYLYLHRNTVLYRLKKIKQLLGIDPLNNFYESQLLFQILHYYKTAHDLIM